MKNFDAANLYKSSASVDPFELSKVDQAEDVKIAQWIAHVTKELDEHRSPFVAADVILKQMQEKAISMRHPDKLYLEVALKVLERCAAEMSSPFKELFLSALHELIPAVLFTRVTYSPATGLETFAKHSFAECFLQVYKVFLGHQHTIEVHDRRVEVERKVMDRVVRKMDGLWVRFSFSAWRIYCQKIREKKLLFAKIAQYSLSRKVAPQMIRRWRQHAHAVMLKAKHQRTNQLTSELNMLQSTVESMKQVAQKLEVEVGQKLKVLTMLQTDYTNAAGKCEDLKQLLDATQKSAEDHWREWQRCKALLFGDSYPLPASMRLGVDGRGGKIEFISNVTDSSALYYRRAKALAKKIDMLNIHRLLRVYGLFPPYETLIQGGIKHLRIPEASPSIETVAALLRSACAPVVSPFVIRDVTHYHRDKFHFVMSFIHSMYAGGHCSLFTAPKIPTQEVEEPPQSPSPTMLTPSVSWTGRLLDAKGGTGSGHLDEAPFIEFPAGEEQDPLVGILSEDLGAQMMQDVSDGLEDLNEACDFNDDVSNAIRRCITNTEVDEVRNYLEGLFDTLATLEMPLNRTKIENVTHSIVDKNDYRVLEALYPPNGIDSFTSLVSYMTGVAEYTSWPILTVAELLESHYELDWRDDMKLALASPDMNHFFALNSKMLRRLEDLLVPKGEEENTERTDLDFELVRKLFASKLQLSTAEMNKIWESAGENPSMVRVSELDQLLYLVASWLDPSPFKPPMHKIATVLDRFIPYIREVRRLERIESREQRALLNAGWKPAIDTDSMVTTPAASPGLLRDTIPSPDAVFGEVL